MSTDRQKVIMATVGPFADVANFSIIDVMTSAQRAVPDVQPEEVAEAFEAIALLAEAEAGVLSAELQRRAQHEER